MATEVRLERDGVLTGWACAVGCVATGGALVAWVLAAGPTVLAINLAMVLLAYGLLLAVLLTRFGDGCVVLGPETIEVRFRGIERTWPWGQVLEVGVNGTGPLSRLLVPGCSVFVRPEGGGWDVPGPNSPQPVALPVFGRRAKRRVRDELERACEAHGVAFSTWALSDGEQPRPGSPLRRERDR